MNYAKIKQYDIANGPGIRTSLFVSGCNFHCEDCFNQEAQDFSYGKRFDSVALRTLMEYVSDPKVDGLSILGGDPLCQAEDGLLRMIDICHRVQDLGKTTWLWSGYTWEQIFSTVVLDQLDVCRELRRELIENVDVFVDGQFDKTKKDLRLRYCGSSNQRVIDVKKSLSKGELVLWTR